MIYRTILLPLVSALSLGLAAQNGEPVHTFPAEEMISETLEQLTESNGEETDLSEWNDELDQLRSDPVNLNSGNDEELRRLCLLNELQIRNLQAYIADYGPVASVYELFLIDGFSQTFIEQIAPFIILENAAAPQLPLRNVLRNGRWKLSCRYQRVLESQAGYSGQPGSDSLASRYAGSPDAVFTRLVWNYQDRLHGGITSEKDAGETLLRKPDSAAVAIDYLSFHLMIRGKKKTHSTIIGDYQMQFGQGLTLWSGMSMGKTSGTLPMRRRGQTIKPHTSANENNFLRGAASSWRKGKMEYTAFVSYRRRDARVNTDSLNGQGFEFFSAVQESGYHRTVSERNNRKSVREFIAGGHVKYAAHRFRIGFSTYHLYYNRNFLPSPVPGNTSEPAETYAGFDYSWSYKRLTFYGESSLALCEGSAHLAGLNFNPDPRIAFSVIYRNYAPAYFNLLSNAFGETAKNSNERGLYFGVQTFPVRNLSMTIQVDYCRFPWLRYQVDAPSSALEYAIFTTYSLGRAGLISMSFKHAEKQGNSSDLQRLLNPLETTVKTSWMLQLRYSVTSCFKLSTRTSIQKVRTASGSTAAGYYLGGDGQIISPNAAWSFTARYAVFDTDDYESRMYVYENDLPSSFSIPSFSGNGSRYYLMLKMRIGSHLDGWLRFSRTMLPMQQEISSGPALIRGNHKSELKAMITYRF